MKREKLLLGLLLFSPFCFEQIAPAKVEESYAVNLSCDDANYVWLRSGRGKENPKRKIIKKMSEFIPPKDMVMDCTLFIGWLGDEKMGLLQKSDGTFVWADFFHQHGSEFIELNPKKGEKNVFIYIRVLRDHGKRTSYYSERSGCIASERSFDKGVMSPEKRYEADNENCEPSKEFLGWLAYLKLHPPKGVVTKPFPE